MPAAKPSEPWLDAVVVRQASLPDRMAALCDGMPDGKVATTKMLIAAMVEQTRCSAAYARQVALSGALEAYRVISRQRAYFGNRKTIQQLKK